MDPPRRLEIKSMPDAQLTAIDQNLIERVRNRIVEAFDPKAIYLFGSAARGTQREGSDLDLLIVMDLTDGMTPRRQASSIRNLFVGWRVPMDIVVQAPETFQNTREKPGRLARIADRQGMRLYG
jgi:predicted nucleotidyltransferase